MPPLLFGPQPVAKLSSILLGRKFVALLFFCGLCRQGDQIRAFSPIVHLFTSDSFKKDRSGQSFGNSLPLKKLCVNVDKKFLG
jgi:hypothetical protein